MMYFLCVISILKLLGIERTAPIHPLRFQKREVSPSRANRASASSTVFLRQLGSRRSGLYHACAKRQHWSRERISPRGKCQSCNHLAICSSDLKSSIVLQLKTMSSHQ